MDSNKVFGQGGKVGESDKLNIDSIIARLLEGKQYGFFSENKENVPLFLYSKGQTL